MSGFIEIEKAKEIYCRVCRENAICFTTPENCSDLAMLETVAAADVRPVERCYNSADIPSLFRCSSCGWECHDTYYCDSQFQFCPHCGRAVVSKDRISEDE